MMKWFAGLLCLINAALFLWATGYDPGRTVSASAYPVVSAEGMRLLSEVKASAEAASGDKTQCARIGPFVSSAVAALAAQKLDSMSMAYTRRTVKSREIRAFRVYLGPFSTESAITAQRRLLESSGISDFYVKRDEQGGGIISLGLFSQRDGAELLLGKLQGQDIQAKLLPEDRVLKPNYWLEIGDPSVAKGVPVELAQASWGEAGAEIRRYDCL